MLSLEGKCDYFLNTIHPEMICSKAIYYSNLPTILNYDYNFFFINYINVILFNPFLKVTSNDVEHPRNKLVSIISVIATIKHLFPHSLFFLQVNKTPPKKNNPPLHSL